MACYRACFEMAKNDTDWFIVIVRGCKPSCKHALPVCLKRHCTAPCPWPFKPARSHIGATPQLVVRHGQRTYTTGPNHLAVPVPLGQSRRIVLIIVFLLAQDDDEFAVPANFDTIPEYLESLDHDVGQVSSPFSDPRLSPPPTDCMVCHW